MAKKDVENFVHEPQILPQKPKIAEKLDLIGQNGYSFSYMWPIIEWNQVKYPKQHLLFCILFPSVIGKKTTCYSLLYSDSAGTTEAGYTPITALTAREDIDEETECDSDD